MIFDILSYNISWGSMQADNAGLNDVTARGLVEKCIAIKKIDPSKSCLSNVSRVIQNSIDPSKNYGFVGLQESAQWGEILHNTPKLQELSYIGFHSSDTGHLPASATVMFYDHTKFILRASIGVNLHRGNDKRPCLMLLLNDAMGNYYMIANLHNAQQQLNVDAMRYYFLQMVTGFGKSYPESALNKKIEYKDAEHKEDVSDIIMSFSMNNPHVIMMGDWNDKRGVFTKGFSPWVQSPFPGLNTINISSQGSVPITCCNGSGTRIDTKHDHSYGDYILISDNTSFGKINHIPEFFKQNANASMFPTSDHMPVMASVMGGGVVHHPSPVLKRPSREACCKCKISGGGKKKSRKKVKKKSQKKVKKKSRKKVKKKSRKKVKKKSRKKVKKKSRKEVKKKV